MTDGKMTCDIHIPLTPELRAEIDRRAQAEALKPATKARQLILLGLAVQKSVQTYEVHHG